MTLQKSVEQMDKLSSLINAPQVCVYVCMCVYVCICIYVCVSVCMYVCVCMCVCTVYMVYLAVALIWRFDESCKYHQIKCTPFRL